MDVVGRRELRGHGEAAIDQEDDFPVGMTGQDGTGGGEDREQNGRYRAGNGGRRKAQGSAARAGGVGFPEGEEGDEGSAGSGGQQIDDQGCPGEEKQEPQGRGEHWECYTVGEGE